METHGRTVGVIVGRFQVAVLHAGHRFLIDTVSEGNDAVMVFIGTNGSNGTDHDPLPFALRKSMIESAYADVLVEEIADQPSNATWSAFLDARIEAAYPNHRVRLYGSRDSFLDSYEGRFETHVVPHHLPDSGSKMRDEIARKENPSAAFREGIIYAHATRHPIVYPTVDIAPVRMSSGEVLLGRKKDTQPGKWRFIGGFVDRADASFELAARRELREEVGAIEIADVTYVCSCPIDDPRYRNSKDGITTTFFRAVYVFGAVTPGDDIVELAWFPLSQLPDVLIHEHFPLGEALIQSLKP